MVVDRIGLSTTRGVFSRSLGAKSFLMNPKIDIVVSFSLVYDMKLIVAITAERMAKLMSIATKPYFSFTMLLGIDTNQSRHVMIMMMPHVVSLRPNDMFMRCSFLFKHYI